MVEHAVAADFHVAVKEVGSSIDSGHVGGGDTVAAAPSALAASHTATHSAHHRACHIVESAVVGVVGVQHGANLVFVGEVAEETGSLEPPVSLNRGGRKVVATSCHKVAESPLHHSRLHRKVEYGFLLSVIDAGKFSLV